MSRKATCSTHTLTEEEGADEREADSAKDKEAEVRPTTTPNFGYKKEAMEEPSQEGGSFHSGPSHQHVTKCGYCRKLGHHEEECRKKKRESASTS